MKLFARIFALVLSTLLAMTPPAMAGLCFMGSSAMSMQNDCCCMGAEQASMSRFAGAMEHAAFDRIGQSCQENCQAVSLADQAALDLDGKIQRVRTVSALLMAVRLALAFPSGRTVLSIERDCVPSSRSLLLNVLRI
jgi:hypothetical protein